MLPQSDTVIVLKQTRAAYQAKADEEHEELKSTLTEGMKAALETEIRASKANLERIQDFIDKTSEELGDLNQADEPVPRAAEAGEHPAREAGDG